MLANINEETNQVMRMKTILAIALLVAMLALPSVLASPNLNPNANPNAPVVPDSVIASESETFGDHLNGPGFSEVGDVIAMLAGENSYWRGANFGDMLPW